MYPELRQLKDEIGSLIASAVGSLHTQMQDMEARLAAELRRIDARQQHQGTWIRSGQVWSAGMQEWCLRTDDLAAERDARIAQIETRLRKLEQRQPPEDA